MRSPTNRPQDAAEALPLLDAGDASQRDLGGDIGISGDVATNADAHRFGDGPPTHDLINASGDDTPGTEPDTAGGTDVAVGDVRGDSYREQDDVPIIERNDASLNDAGGDERPTQTVDAPADVTSSSDGVVTGGVDVESDDASGPEATETGWTDGDAQTSTPDTGSEGADGAPPLDPDLVLWYAFDEASGTVAYDSAQFEGVARNATLMTAGMGASAGFSTDKQVGTHSLALVPTAPAASGGGYVVIPTIQDLAPNAITIAVWVKLPVAGPAQVWERIYDFGDSSTSPCWFNLAARGGTGPGGPVFNMSNTGHNTGDQQKLSGSTALKANTWYHIAVVLPAGAPYTGVMYVNGVVADSNSAMTLHLSDIGPTVNNWLGRSQFTDPYFNGVMDDFRVYRRALSQQEIVELMALR